MNQMAVTTLITLATWDGLHMALAVIAVLFYLILSLAIRPDISILHRGVQALVAGVFGYATSRVGLRVAMEHLQGLFFAIVAFPGGWTMSDETILHILVAVGFLSIATVPVQISILARYHSLDIRDFFLFIINLVKALVSITTKIFHKMFTENDMVNDFISRFLVGVTVVLVLTLRGATEMPDGRILTYSGMISLLTSSNVAVLLAVMVVLYTSDAVLG